MARWPSAAAAWPSAAAAWPGSGRVAGQRQRGRAQQRGGAAAAWPDSARLHVLADAAHLAAIASAHEVTGELIGHFQQAVTAGEIWRSER
jgi:hypothetical protein